MMYSVDLILYKSSHLTPLSPLEVLGEFAKNRFGKNFPVAVNKLMEKASASSKSQLLQRFTRNSRTDFAITVKLLHI